MSAPDPAGVATFVAGAVYAQLNQFTTSLEARFANLERENHELRMAVNASMETMASLRDTVETLLDRIQVGSEPIPSPIDLSANVLPSPDVTMDRSGSNNSLEKQAALGELCKAFEAFRNDVLYYPVVRLCVHKLVDQALNEDGNGLGPGKPSEDWVVGPEWWPSRINFKRQAIKNLPEVRALFCATLLYPRLMPQHIRQAAESALVRRPATTPQATARSLELLDRAIEIAMQMRTSGIDPSIVSGPL